MSIVSNVGAVKEKIKEACDRANRSVDEVTVVGVTKYVDVSVANALIEAGIVNLGENRPNSFLEKCHNTSSSAVWHFIGSLQSRKVRGMINKVDFLHSLDRLSLAEEINKHANKVVNCFIQVNVSGEQSKHGLAPVEVIPFIRQLATYEKIKVVGLMTMAPFTEDVSIVRKCFSGLRQLKDDIVNLRLSHAPCTELSMGMSNDFEIAIEEGATYVRIGSLLTD